MTKIKNHPQQRQVKRGRNLSRLWTNVDQEVSSLCFATLKNLVITNKENKTAGEEIVSECYEHDNPVQGKPKIIRRYEEAW